jgi:menaquinone-dependent protoporphyrinogen oxidase
MMATQAHILVAYASGTGSTGEVADAIAAVLRDEQVQVDVQRVQDVSGVSAYSAVVLGSSIRVGRWLPEAVEFLEKHAGELAGRPVAYFTTCLTMVVDTPENRRIVRGYLEPVLALVPEIEPVGLGLFAGSLNPGMQPVVPGGGPYGDYRDWAKIREWARQIQPHLLAQAPAAGRKMVLSGYVLSYTDLSGLDLQGIDMQGTELQAARLRRTRLQNADLQSADLTGADLQQADLVEASLGWADLSQADLSQANLHRANLIGTILRQANLRGANLSEALLNGAELVAADLAGANLARADLNWAVLRRANLQGTDLNQASLGWADFSRTNVGAANLTEARYNEQTKWPKGFSPEKAGCILVSGPH